MEIDRSEGATEEASFGRFGESWAAALPDANLGDFLQATALMRIGRILDLEFDRMCRREHDIGATDMRVLLTLRRVGAPFELRPTDLFKAILVSSGGMSRQIDRLVEKGLVKRKPDRRHAGGFLIGLTGRGKKTTDATLDTLINHSLLLAGTSSMSAVEKRTGARYVTSLLEALERFTGYGITLPHK